MRRAVFHCFMAGAFMAVSTISSLGAAGTLDCETVSPIVSQIVRGTNCTNYVDEDKDGVCDNYADRDCPRDGTGNQYGGQHGRKR